MESGVLEQTNFISDCNKLAFNKKKSGAAMRFVVTGGCGYFGFCLANSLQGLNGEIVLADVHLPPRIQDSLTDKMSFRRTDICDYQQVLDAFENADCVFHVASFGMTGNDQLNQELTEDVNVNGTKNVIEACCECGVENLIYTSSYNVSFTNIPIINGTNEMPYADPNEMVEFYSITKQKSDQQVLAANGRQLDGGKILRTCCIRPPGIIGPGEKRHMDRMVKCIQLGMMYFDVFDDALLDWVNVSNLVQAHLLAVVGLSESRGYIAAGQAYFISDGHPMTMKEFLAPLVQALGFPPPFIRIPSVIVYYFAFLMELLHFLLKPFCTFHPLLTRHEVLKMTVSHYQDMSQANADLGYRPRYYSVESLVNAYMKENNLMSVTSANVKEDEKENYRSGLFKLQYLSFSWKVFLTACLACILTYCSAVPLGI